MNEKVFFNQLSPEQPPKKERPAKRPTPEEQEVINEYYAGGTHTHSKESNREMIGGAQEDVRHNPERLLRLAEATGRAIEVITNHASNPKRPRVLAEDDPICLALLKEKEQIVAANQAVQEKDWILGGKREKQEKEGEKERKIPTGYAGVEASIFFNEDGEAVLDVPDKVLEKMDMVIASRHSIKDEKDPEKIKKSLMVAIDNPEVDVIGHPYKNIEFYENDWRYFRKYHQEKNSDISGRLEELNKGENKDKIKEIIGKEKPKSEETRELNEEFKQLKEKYWDSWDEILDKMAENKKAFEINLNVFRPNKEFYQTILAKAAEKEDLLFSISFDFHSIEQIDGFEEEPNKKETDKEKLNTREKAVQRIMKVIALLKQNNIKPERIINSSQERLEEFLERDK